MNDHTHKHFHPRPDDMWCDSIDRAYGELLAKNQELERRLVAAEESIAELGQWARSKDL